jgi:hypothetical protein
MVFVDKGNYQPALGEDQFGMIEIVELGVSILSVN